MKGSTLMLWLGGTLVAAILTVAAPSAGSQPQSVQPSEACVSRNELSQSPRALHRTE